MRRLPSHPLEADRCAQSPGARTGQAAVTPLHERPAVRAARARGSEDAGGPRALGAAPGTSSLQRTPLARAPSSFIVNS